MSPVRIPRTPSLALRKEIAEYLGVPEAVVPHLGIGVIQIGSLYRYRWASVDGWLQHATDGEWPGGAPVTSPSGWKDIARALKPYVEEWKRKQVLLERRRARKAAKEAGLSIKRILITEDALRLVLEQFMPKDRVAQAIYECGTAAIEVTEPELEMKRAMELARKKEKP